MATNRDDVRQTWAAYEMALAALQADPEAWAEYQQAGAAWDATIRSGHGTSHSAQPNPSTQARSEPCRRS